MQKQSGPGEHVNGDGLAQLTKFEFPVQSTPASDNVLSRSISAFHIAIVRKWRPPRDSTRWNGFTEQLEAGFFWCVVFA